MQASDYDELYAELSSMAGGALTRDIFDRDHVKSIKALSAPPGDGDAVPAELPMPHLRGNSPKRRYAFKTGLTNGLARPHWRSGSDSLDKRPRGGFAAVRGGEIGRDTCDDAGFVRAYTDMAAAGDVYDAGFARAYTETAAGAGEGDAHDAGFARAYTDAATDAGGYDAGFARAYTEPAGGWPYTDDGAAAADFCDSGFERKDSDAFDIGPTQVPTDSDTDDNACEASSAQSTDVVRGFPDAGFTRAYTEPVAGHYPHEPRSKGRPRVGAARPHADPAEESDEDVDRLCAELAGSTGAMSIQMFKDQLRQSFKSTMGLINLHQI